MDDQCTDLAAALTYYAVLALFPAAIALLSLVGLVGQGPKTVDTLLQILRDVGASRRRRHPRADDLTQLAASLSAPGWRSSSASPPRCGRPPATSARSAAAMNRIYEIDEGRPIWKLRPLMLAGHPGRRRAGRARRARTGRHRPGRPGGRRRDRARVDASSPSGTSPSGRCCWPSWCSSSRSSTTPRPTCKQPKFRWISVGAIVAILVWVVASAAFGFYVANFSSYNKTYGSLAGVIVFLLWLWITNLALLFGAELDAELERGRELQAGMRRRGGAPAAAARHPQERQGRRQGAEGHRARAQAARVAGTTLLGR